MKIGGIKNKIKDKYSFLFNILKFFYFVWLRIRQLLFLNQFLYLIARVKGILKWDSVRFESCICGDNDYKLFLDYGRYKVLECKKCGLKRTSPLPGEAVYNNGEIVDSYLYSHREYLHPQIINLLNHIDSFSNINDNILDIGCGDGGALKFLHERGYGNLFGIELSRVLNKIASEKGIAKIYDKSIENCIMDNKFKLIYLNHVFEHIINLEEFLKAAEYSLTDGGRLIIASPNINSIFSVNANWGYAFSQHYWQFTPKTLQLIVEKKSNLKMESFFTIRGDKFWKIKLFKKMKIEGDVVCMTFKK